MDWPIQIHDELLASISILFQFHIYKKYKFKEYFSFLFI